MTWETWMLYATTVLLLMSTPGPSHLLMLSNSMAHGFKPSLATAAGDLTANTLQILAAGLGLAGMLMASRHGFTIVKWGGVAYLAWLGIRMFMRAGQSLDVHADVKKSSLKTLWLQGFITSAANPKAVVFFAALLPQFIDPAFPLWPQLLALGATYIVIDGCFLSSYGASADWLAKRLKGPVRQWVGRISGGCLIGAAILLSFKTIRQTG